MVPFPHPWVDADVGPFEDAAVVHPPSGSSLVLTLDFITPVVDDPEAFGAIAAANALSDVYAMGGEPHVALAICGFPENRVPREILERVLRGARDKAAEAVCAIVGGHTIQDDEMKYGLSVVGTVDPRRVLTHTHARVGDKLVLTKPIGFGVAAQALKKDRLPATEVARLTSLMSTLNRAARDAALAAGARAATDVTGFGLLAHLRHLLLGSGVGARIFASQVPVLECAWALAREGILPGGSRRNLAYVTPHTQFDPRLDEATRLILADAQTSGGLLIAISPQGEQALLSELTRGATPARAVIGEVVAGDPGHIEVVA